METVMANNESSNNNQIQKIADKYGKAKKEAWAAQRARVSRRLLLAIRAEKLTVVCPISGIVTLLEVPAIPGYSLEYEHPLSTLENCRNLAQRGIDYLRKLDTQTLAGMLIILASAYDLFKFQPSDSGAQKNAILRTAGKDLLIDTILVIEDQIHSRNARYCPKLSLVQDVIADNNSTAIDTRLHNYLALLTESLRKPDLSEYDENAAPKKIGRPLYIRDVLKQEKAISYLARQEIAAAKRELASDAKAAKTLAANLVAVGASKPGMKAFMAQLMADNGMGLVEADPALIDMLITQKLAPLEENHNDATKLIAILRKDRSILKKETAEEEFLDDPTPGNEAAIDDNEEFASFATPEPMESPAIPDAYTEDSEAQESKGMEPSPPEGLSFVEKILWKKKWKESQKTVQPYKHARVEEIPSVHVYIPTEEKKKLGDGE